MAVFKAINVKVGKNANLKGIINYVLKPSKTEEQLTTGFYCDVPFGGCHLCEFLNEKTVQAWFAATESDAAAGGLEIKVVDVHLF